MTEKVDIGIHEHRFFCSLSVVVYACVSYQGIGCRMCKCPTENSRFLLGFPLYLNSTLFEVNNVLEHIINQLNICGDILFPLGANFYTKQFIKLMN